MKVTKNKNIIENIIKIVFIIFMVISIGVFVRANLSDAYYYSEIYYLPLVIIELINIIFGVLFFRKKKVPNKYIIIYLVFLLILFCVPVYYNAITRAPTGPNSYLMGLVLEKRYLNVYGINIIELINILK